MPPSCLFRAACSQIDKGAVVSLSMSHALSGIDNKRKSHSAGLEEKPFFLLTSSKNSTAIHCHSVEAVVGSESQQTPQYCETSCTPQSVVELAPGRQQILAASHRRRPLDMADLVCAEALPNPAHDLLS